MDWNKSGTIEIHAGSREVMLNGEPCFVMAVNARTALAAGAVAHRVRCKSAADGFLHSVVYVCMIQDNGSKGGFAIVPAELEKGIDCIVKQTGVGPDLFSVARDYTRKEKPFTVLRIEEALGLPVSDDPEQLKMYVVTNPSARFGAFNALDYDGGAYQKICRAIGAESYHLIPSSVHECIVIPSLPERGADEYSDIIRSINGDSEHNGNMADEEILADHEYFVQGMVV